MDQSSKNNKNYWSDQSDRSNQSSRSGRSDLNNRSDRSGRSDLNNLNDRSSPTSFLSQHGHYRHLRVYQVTEIIYDITYYFTQHFLSRGDRTVDQMVQAARSGKQNIAEGNQAAATSSETEIKLTNVAKASLEELERAVPALQQQLAQAKAEVAEWKAKYEDLMLRTSNA